MLGPPRDIVIVVSGHTFVQFSSLAHPALCPLDPPGGSADAVWAEALDVAGCKVAAAWPREGVGDRHIGIAFCVFSRWTQPQGKGGQGENWPGGEEPRFIKIDE